MSYEPLCAVCGRKVYPGDEHRRVTSEPRGAGVDPRDEEEFYFHPECYANTTDGWARP